MKQERTETKPFIGSLCTGYGGLDIAVLAVFGGRLAWCADNDKHVSVILDARYPDTPNLGDLTALDWVEVPTVDIICAGFPCQDISYSGRGAGIEKGVRSGIWRNIITGIRSLRPKLIVVENVAAIRSRGLHRVLGDLAACGYDGSWTSLRASDVGAAHRRERVFVLAYRPEAANILAAADARGQRWQRWAASCQAPSGWTPGGLIRPGHITLGATAERVQVGHAEASSVGKIAWGRYEAAIRRWEAFTGREAPYPVERGTRGQPRLAATFSEWLMGLPSGFVTGLGLSYSAQHRALGNGVMPQQAVVALWQLVTMVTGRQTEDNQAHERGMAA
ncbi:MAG TPA: DNA cytosine methyltransferase [Streptosporangiaceae bacterium]|nr:DNA cytosine methyltransferase [Streptosporangiaceae bacterium]